MALPSQTTTLQDPGLGKTEPVSTTPAILGLSSGGTATANTLYTYSSPAAVKLGHGDGPLVEAACEHLIRAGGIARVIQMTQDSAGTMTATLTGGTDATIVDNSSTPYNWFGVRYKIVLGGALGTARFQFSLDGGRSYSDTYTTAASFTIPNSGISVTMSDVPGVFIVDEVYVGVATGPTYTSSEMDTAVAALKASPFSWDYGVLTGRHADASTAQTVFNALDADRIGLGEPHQYKPWIMDAGGDNKATTASTFTATSKWILRAYGTTDMVTQTPVAGYKVPALPNYMFAVQKAGVADLSEHWGRRASGPLKGIAAWTTEFGSPLSHDEYADEGLDELNFMTVGHPDGAAAGRYYIVRGRVAAPPGSDFRQWQYSRMWSATYQTIYAIQELWIGRSWAVKSDGTLVDGEAKAAEDRVVKAMKTVLHVKNAEGTLGHCSIVGDDLGFYYRISRTQDVRTTDTVATEWGIYPRGYSEYITTTGGFVAQTAS